MVLSDIVWIPFEKPVDSVRIERILTEKYGEIVRWAVIDVTPDKLKVCLSFIKKD